MHLGYFTNLGQGWVWQRWHLFSSGTSQKNICCHREVACAVIVEGTGVFVDKGAKEEHVGDGLIFDIINEGGMGLVAVLLVVIVRN
jgi:hypothetical protein